MQQWGRILAGGAEDLPVQTIMRAHRILAALFVMALAAAACSSGPRDDPASVPPVKIGGFDFLESTMLANLYGRALEEHGYRVELNTNLGNREVAAPALRRGDIDLYLGYAASELEFVNQGAGEASADVEQTVRKLRDRLEPSDLTALNPSPAVDTNMFAVTRSTAARYDLETISDLVPVAGQLTLGGPPECPARPFCLAGLEKTYGLRFKGFRSLDAGGPLSKDALEAGEIDVALVFSTDGAVFARGLIVLEDDKALQLADNIVPLIRTSVASSRVRAILNGVSAALTTAELAKLNIRAQDEDPAALADSWLRAHRLNKDRDRS